MRTCACLEEQNRGKVQRNCSLGNFPCTVPCFVLFFKAKMKPKAHWYAFQRQAHNTGTPPTAFSVLAYRHRFMLRAVFQTKLKGIKTKAEQGSIPPATVLLKQSKSLEIPKLRELKV